MKQTLKTLMLAVAATVALLFSSMPNANAQTATLTDLDGANPSPGTNDIFMIDFSTAANPGTLNYYSNGGNGIPPQPPGETFTTGNNPLGYTLNAVSVLTGGNGGDGLPTNATVWYLRIYSISASSNATLLTTYASEPFTFDEFDWIQWTGFSVGLSPNTKYAYSVQNGGTGWEQMDGEDTAGSTTLFTNGTALVIPTTGGQLKRGMFATGWVADFDLGLTPITSLVVDQPTVATTGNGYYAAVNIFSNTTTVTIDASGVLGASPFFYQWQTDGGSGAALTNIPGANATNLIVNTTSLGNFVYDLVVSNNLNQSATSPPVSIVVSYPITPASLSEEGTNYASFPYYPTISQLSGGGTGDNINYYDNNNSPAGQIFTTGTNSQGYILDSVQIHTGGGPADSSSATGTPQPYYLSIYQININANETNAVLLQVYTNASFSFTFNQTLGDWLEWSGLNTPLSANTQYAYTFQNGGTGWAGLDSSSSNVYSGGELVQINPADGSISFDTATNSGVFYLQFTAVGQLPPQPTAPPISPSPSSGFVGTQFTLTETASGASPLSYYWLTDGGSGGALTNIPGNNVSNLVLNTTGWNPGAYSYQVIVSNSYATATSSIVTVGITLPPAVNTNGVLTDIGLNQPTPGANDIYQTNEFQGSLAAPNGPQPLNYYFDNSAPPGDTFTTGSNPSGYVLNSVAIELAGDDTYVTPDFPTNGQGYVVYIYNIYTDQGGQYAALYATYNSQTNFVISKGTIAAENDTDWLEMTGISLPLQPNTVYAYTFGEATGDSDYDDLAAVTNNTYAGGQAVCIAPTGGQIQTSATPGWNGTFDLGLSVQQAAPTISISYVGGQIQLQWSAGSLLVQAPSVTGPWTTNAATSPYTVTPSAPQQFYRAVGP
jgi:hypothetical protein